MRIGQVAPLHESVPPRLYGGTERVVSYLTEELVRLGHEVTLFASGDSETEARLIAPCERGLRLDGKADAVAYHALMVEMVQQFAPEADILHYHIDYLHFSVARLRNVPHVTTLHGRLDLPELEPLFREFREVPVVSISRAQRRPLPWIGWVGNVPHGLPRDLYRFEPERGDYLAWIGRFSPEKRPERAVEIAERAGLPLRMAGKVDPRDREYFEEVARPLLSRSHVEYVGEIGGAEKEAFLGGARALVFSIDWPEPFGLVMVEAMACGTPVIAFRRGSVPEVVEDGRTGVVVDTVEEAVDAVRSIDGISREVCREVFEKRFTVERMARDYLQIYRRTIERARETRSRRRPRRPRKRPAPAASEMRQR